MNNDNLKSDVNEPKNNTIVSLKLSHEKQEDGK